MIVYDLQCQNGHQFEGWFEDAQAFKKQQKAELIACPVCGVTDVTRIPSTFAIKGSPAKPKTDDPHPDIGTVTRAFAEFMENNFDNVGTDFAKEALKIHYGINEPRNIRGVSTAQEEETLRQEGVQFVKLPMPLTTQSSDTEPNPDQ